MKAFETFYITATHFDEETFIATFFYSFDHEVEFSETIDFSQAVRSGEVDKEIMNMLLFHSSIALGVSYYKLSPTAEIVVEHGTLDKEQKAFRHRFYIQGLGEFFYTNDLSPEGLAHFKSISSHEHLKAGYHLDESYLVPIGGGKDSCVSIDVLTRENKDITLYTNGRDYSVHQDIESVSGYPRIFTKRTIDPLLISLTKEGGYNGHVPITGMISFLTLIVSYLGGHKHIIFSNEKSANFGNTTWKGIDINHQRSKSAAFEEVFQQYVSSYIHEGVEYRSELRKRFELRIAKEFSSLSEYFTVFTSCNRNFHLSGDSHQRWCGVCPKCLFTYAMLRPFISSEHVLSIRGEEYYNNKKTLPLRKELWGISGIKPFECVGTYEEVQRATRKYMTDYPESGRIILDEFRTHVVKTKSHEEREKLGRELLR